MTVSPMKFRERDQNGLVQTVVPAGSSSYELKVEGYRPVMLHDDGSVQTVRFERGIPFLPL